MLSLNLQEKSRRDFMKLSAAGVFAPSLSGWLGALAAHTAHAADSPNGARKHKSCILLWADGGASHKDTLDLKPGTKDAGEFKEIATAVPGIKISEHLPKIAGLMNHSAILRGMSTGEGAHGRAKYYLHTGYKEGVGGLVYPSIGSLTAAELGNPDAAMPNFVTIGNRAYGAGFLGAKHMPLVVNDPAKGVEDLKPLVASKQFENRVGLLDQLEQSFYHNYQAGTITSHKTTYERAVKLIQSKEVKAFDISAEGSSAASRYGGTKFGEGCLMARRLVEVGVPFVEVSLGGWDTHQDNWTKVKNLSQTIDNAIGALVTDLKERGLLDSTLVIWMGEFGRTPKINTRGAKPGRDHYARAWSSLMIGGGIKGGQVIGRTDKEGAVVEERPIPVVDFMATVCSILGIDFKKQNEAGNGRPIRIVDKGAKPITELLA